MGAPTDSGNKPNPELDPANHIGDTTWVLKER